MSMHFREQALGSHGTYFEGGTVDVDQQRTFVRANGRYLRQLSPGSDDHSVIGVSLANGLTVVEETHSVAIEEHFIASPAMALFSQTLDNGGSMPTASRRPSGVMISQGGGETCSVTPREKFTHLVVQVSRDVLEIDRDDGFLLSNEDQAANTDMVWLSRSLIRNSTRDYSPWDSDYYNIVSETLLDRLDAIYRGPGTATFPLHQGFLYKQYLRIADLVHQSAVPPTTLRSLAKQLGTTRAVVRDAIAHATQIDPDRWLSAVRLNKVRQHLLSPACRDQTITEVALHFGYVHMGRFSTSYRNLFGMTPTQTRRA